MLRSCLGEDARAQILFLPFQGRRNRGGHQAAHRLAVTETDLALGRMHIHIHLGGRQHHLEHARRLVAPHQMPLQGIAHRIAEHVVLHGPLVDKEPEPGRTGRCLLGQEQIALHPHAFPHTMGNGVFSPFSGIQADERVLIAEDAAQALGKAFFGRAVQHGAAIHPIPEGHQRMRQGQVLHALLHVEELRAL